VHWPSRNYSVVRRRRRRSVTSPMPSPPSLFARMFQSEVPPGAVFRCCRPVTRNTAPRTPGLAATPSFSHLPPPLCFPTVFFFTRSSASRPANPRRDGVAVDRVFLCFFKNSPRVPRHLALVCHRTPIIRSPYPPASPHKSSVSANWLNDGLFSSQSVACALRGSTHSHPFLTPSSRPSLAQRIRPSPCCELRR